jgi:hypothetical protein
MTGAGLNRQERGTDQGKETNTHITGLILEKIMKNIILGPKAMPQMMAQPMADPIAGTINGQITR